MRFKSDIRGIVTLGLIFLAASFYTPPGLRKSEKISEPVKTSGVERVVKPAKENPIPRFHRMGWGESLYGVAKRYYPHEDHGGLMYQADKIAKLNWDEEERKQRDTDGDGIADHVVYNKIIRVRE